MKQYLNKNKLWSERIKSTAPEFFTESAKGQSPEILWIGCSDSRVPASGIMDLLPGEMFVHRNIANLVVHTDLSCLSVLQYAVEVLKVKHIVVCGHYGCGGVKAAISKESYGLIDNWLTNIKDLYRNNKKKLDGIDDEEEKFKLLCEINVIEQVNNLCSTNIVQNAWKENDRELSVHGWIYSLESGLLKNLEVTCSNQKDIKSIYRFN